MSKTIKVKSDSFVECGLIPKEHTGEGVETSPHLSWDYADGVKSWTIISDDPDAPGGTYVHWVLFDLPGEKTSLPAGASGNTQLLDGGKEGVNGSGNTGYIGPYPPDGTHHYYFKVYGLDETLGLNEKATEEQVMEEMSRHTVVAEGQIMGHYSLQVRLRRRPE
jgi:Raf kinase inhibitor-like YbhB/YbcL family protein